MSFPADVPVPDAPAALVAAMRAWRAAHPTATFAEIEVEATRQVAALRRALIQAAVTDAAPATAPCCPDCGRSMARNGTRTRTLVTSGGEMVPITGARYRCSACGAELFPPR
jgi:hypothetical protein